MTLFWNVQFINHLIYYKIKGPRYYGEMYSIQYYVLKFVSFLHR